MNDTISRQAAIDALGGNEPVGDPSKMDDDDVVKMWERIRIINIINKLPSAQPECKTGRWIPCSERLPEKGGDYLTTLTDKDGNYVDVTEWQNIIGGRWIAPLDECDYCEIGNVVAWMPLPEPYREEGE